MPRTIFVLLALCLAGTTAPAAPLPAPPASATRLDAWSGDLSASPPAWSAEPQRRFAESQPRRAQTHQRRAQARREAASSRAVASPPQLQLPPMPQPAPLLRNAELVPAPVATTAAIPATVPTVPGSTQVAQAQPQQPQAQGPAAALPRSRNEPSPADGSASYSTRAANYWSDAVDYVRGGLGSITGYLPEWPFGWSSSEDAGTGQSRERLLVEAMTAAGYELASVARDGTLVTTVAYTFRQQRRPSPSDRLLAAKLAADLAAVSGGLGGYLEQVMIKTALEGETAVLDVQTFELQTRPYPWLRSVSGPRSASR
jgi:hypothetical protein